MSARAVQKPRVLQCFGPFDGHGFYLGDVQKPWFLRGFGLQGGEKNVNVTKRHACHTKRRSMSPSATPATQTAVATRRETGSPEHQVPHLPRKVTVDVAKRDACRKKRKTMSPSATHATQTAVATTAPNRTQARHQGQPCHTCHACHAK